MTRIRRALTVAGLTVAVAIGVAVPASAAFSDSVVLSSTVATGSVAAPATVTTRGTCTQTTSSYWNGYTTVYTTQYWYDASMSWSASTTTRGVTGYRVMVYLNTGQAIVLGETDPYNRTMTERVDRSYLNYQPRVSVITLTSYGWTTESPRTAVPPC
ncbi:hypothetical protein DQ237_11715 [Blastococcus sp. TF02-8]|uniref:hypothetical protein n=1 Tax=Blastococcus sp. TF02-8 TaxID=2250574 RepID=UPI000DE87E00|nr:hypothetical protein [Blastococcus sp. TF02-8]RBY95811.1 hypothetical protein DQ237_11715 [Blastococcus sp. TF02-8]